MTDFELLYNDIILNFILLYCETSRCFQTLISTQDDEQNQQKL